MIKPPPFSLDQTNRRSGRDSFQRKFSQREGCARQETCRVLITHGSSRGKRTPLTFDPPEDGLAAANFRVPSVSRARNIKCFERDLAEEFFRRIHRVRRSDSSQRA
jgi:hypothetical protein